MPYTRHSCASTPLRDGKSIDHPYAWARRVAYNLMLDEIEHAERTRPICPEADESVCDPLPTPHQAIVTKHRRKALNGEWWKLSEIERTCLFLRIEGMTLTEVGEVVNLRHQRVGEIVARAIKRLKAVAGE